MPTSEYERFRRKLEQQLRADFELLLAGYRAKLRAFEILARTRGELDPDDEEGGWPALEMPANLLPPAGAGRELLPAGGAAPAAAGALPDGAPGAAPAPAPATPARLRTAAYEIRDLVDEALLRVGEIFDREELCRAMGCTPKRTTLFRAIQDLEWEGAIVVHERVGGRNPTRYRKVPPGQRGKAAGEDPGDSGEPS